MAQTKKQNEPQKAIIFMVGFSETTVCPVDIFFSEETANKNFKKAKERGIFNIIQLKYFTNSPIGYKFVKEKSWIKGGEKNDDGMQNRD